jgi:CubicO group peptidase (beta-lactamase class C family)
MTSSSIEQQVESHLAALLQTGKLPGIQYMVVDQRDVRFEYCGGRRDVASDLPVTASTTFMASSSSKTLTAAAVLQLKDSGAVDLAASLSTYYPSQPYGDDVKIGQLLNQTSGTPNPMPTRWLHTVGEHADFDEDGALQAVLDRYSKLRFAPGTRYAYSNISYWLLGKVIEQVSGLSYGEYMRERVFDPLGISSDELDCLIPSLERHACGHLRKRSMFGMLSRLMLDRRCLDVAGVDRLRFKPVYMNGPAYGGLIGTTHAFAKFLQDQLRPSSVLFGDDTKRLFYSEQMDGQGRPIETTLGWHRGVLSGTEYYGKPGGGPGFQSNIRIYPAKALATVWLANEAGGSEGPIHKLTDSLDRYFL